MNRNFNKRVGWKVFVAALRAGDLETCIRTVRMAVETPARPRCGLAESAHRMNGGA